MGSHVEPNKYIGEYNQSNLQSSSNSVGKVVNKVNPISSSTDGQSTLLSYIFSISACHFSPLPGSMLDLP